MITKGQTGSFFTMKEYHENPIIQEHIELMKAKKVIEEIVSTLKEEDINDEEA